MRLHQLSCPKPPPKCQSSCGRSVRDVVICPLRTLSVACEQPSVHGFMDSATQAIPTKTPHVLLTYHQKKSGNGDVAMAGFPGLGRSCTGGQQRSDLDPPMDHAVGHANGLGGCHQGPEIPITGPIFLVVHVGRERSSIKSFQQRKPCVVWNQPRQTKQKLGCAPCLGTGDIKRSQETKEKQKRWHKMQNKRPK